MTVSMITTLLLAIVGLDLQGMFPGVAEPAAYDEWTEPVYEQTYYEEAYYEPYYEPYYAPSYATDCDFATQGVVEYDGRTETWYSSNATYHYQTPEWTLDDEGFYRTDEGYYVVAASDYEQGEIIETSRGEAQVLDSGCADGTTDFYVGW